MLDYMAIDPNLSITFYKSIMQLRTVSDASYLLVSKVRSCIGGYYYLGSFLKPDTSIEE